MGEALIVRRGGGGGKVDVAVAPLPEFATMETPRVTPMNAPLCARLGDGSVIMIQQSASVAVVNALRYYVDGHQEQYQAFASGAAPASAAMTELGGGRVLLAGGSRGTSSGTFTSAVTCFDQNNVITTFTSLSQARGYMGRATDGDGRAIFAGGVTSQGTASNVVDRIDQNGVLTVLPTLGTARRYLKGARFGDGSVGFFGGNDGNVLAQADRYDLNGNRNALSNLSAARYLHTVASLGDGRIAIFGGIGSSNALNTVEVYTSNNVKSTLPNLSSPRYNLSAATDGLGRIVVAGGNDPSKNIERYSPDGTKEALTNMPTGLSEPAVCTMGDGSVVICAGSPAAAYRVNGGKKQITVPACNAYRFAEHGAEQPPNPVDTPVVVLTPTTGYFKQKRGAITI